MFNWLAGVLHRYVALAYLRWTNFMVKHRTFPCIGYSVITLWDIPILGSQRPVYEKRISFAHIAASRVQFGPPCFVCANPLGEPVIHEDSHHTTWDRPTVIVPVSWSRIFFNFFFRSAASQWEGHFTCHFISRIIKTALDYLVRDWLDSQPDRFHSRVSFDRRMVVVDLYRHSCLTWKLRYPHPNHQPQRHQCLYAQWSDPLFWNINLL